MHTRRGLPKCCLPASSIKHLLRYEEERKVYGAHNFHPRKGNQLTITPWRNLQGTRIYKAQNSHNCSRGIQARLSPSTPPGNTTPGVPRVKPPPAFDTKKESRSQHKSPNSSQSPMRKSKYLSVLPEEQENRIQTGVHFFLSSKELSSILQQSSPETGKHQERTNFTANSTGKGRRDLWHCTLQRCLLSALLSVPMIKGDPAFHLKEGLDFVWSMRKWLGMFCGREG